MPEIMIPVKTMQIGYKCDACNDGFYNATESTTFKNNPPFRSICHKCDRCGDIRLFTKRYPLMGIREITRYILDSKQSE